MLSTTFSVVWRVAKIYKFNRKPANSPDISPQAVLPEIGLGSWLKIIQSQPSFGLRATKKEATKSKPMASEG